MRNGPNKKAACNRSLWCPQLSGFSVMTTSNQDLWLPTTGDHNDSLRLLWELWGNHIYNHHFTFDYLAIIWQLLQLSCNYLVMITIIITMAIITISRQGKDLPIWIQSSWLSWSFVIREFVEGFRCHGGCFKLVYLYQVLALSELLSIWSGISNIPSQLISFKSKYFVPPAEDSIATCQPICPSGCYQGRPIISSGNWGMQ